MLQQLHRQRLTSLRVSAILVSAMICCSIVSYKRTSVSMAISRAGSKHHMMVISANESFQHCYSPLSEPDLLANFAQLTDVVSRSIGPYLAFAHLPPAEVLMRRAAPVFNCIGWRLHSPSGKRNYTRPELMDIARADADAAVADSRLPVPNVAHFILPFADPRLQFHHLVCILSCTWLMRPRLLYLWYDRARPPVGDNWRLLRENLTAAGVWESRVVLAGRDTPRSVYGAPMNRPEHQADLMRLEAVLSFGGVYMDLDVVTLKSLEPLRRFPFVIGRQDPSGLCNGAFLAEPGNQLLAMWHLAYQTFDQRWWAVHSVTLPHSLCNGFPHLCRIEERSMQRPTWTSSELPWIYGPNRVWNWRSKNYMVHLWYRHHRVQYNLTTIRRVDSMLGDVFRYVLFGSEVI